VSPTARLLRPLPREHG